MTGPVDGWDECLPGDAYDTAWLASVPRLGAPTRARFPSAVQWLLANQRADGSWGGSIRYEHDRILSTLAALPALARFGGNDRGRASLAAATRYLWQHGHLIAAEPVPLVGFELLLPALVDRAERAGVAVPPTLDLYGRERLEKLRLLAPDGLYSPSSTISHSLEFLGELAELSGMRATQGANGSIGNSPAATAFFLALSGDARAAAYLQAAVATTADRSAPVLYPCETFVLLWSAYHRLLGGTPAATLLTPAARAALQAAVASGGVSLSPSFPIPDADDTAVALLLLHAAGEAVDASVLQPFARADGTFASFPNERHGSVGVNLHVLHTLLSVPGFPDTDRVILTLLGYLEGQQVHGLYWLDKWHISPYYATAHALQVLGALPARYAAGGAGMVQRARQWLSATQHADGSWGFYEAPTAEETAYGILGLASGPRDAMTQVEVARCTAAARYLASATHDADPYPPLWVDKCLYAPRSIIRAALEAAAIVANRLQMPVGERPHAPLGARDRTRVAHA